MKLIPVRIAFMKTIAVAPEAELAAIESPARWADAAARLVPEVEQLQGLAKESSFRQPGGFGTIVFQECAGNHEHTYM